MKLNRLVIYFMMPCFASVGAAGSRFNTAFISSVSTLISIPARICGNRITDRASKSCQPKFMASVMSAKAKLANRMGTPRLRANSVEISISLWTVFKVALGGENFENGP